MLAQLLPSVEDTWLLTACLGDDETVDEAWRSWLQAVTGDGTPARRALATRSALLPLLGWNLTRNRVPTDSELSTHLKAARFTEELRLATYQRIASSAFDLLDRSGVPFIVLKGAALGATVYPSPVLRHADDIDLLLEERDLTRATDVLVRAGWRRARSYVLPSAKHEPPLVDRSGLTIELHRRLLIPFYTVPYEELWRRTDIARVAGVDVRTLSPADALLYACAHAMSERPFLHWVADAWFLLRRHADLDWGVFAATARAGKLDLPVSVALRYLADDMRMPIPHAVLTDLEARARHTTRRGLAAARPWPGASPSAIRTTSASGWRKMQLAWTRLFPPPLTFALRHDVPLWTVPYYYVVRLVLFARGWRSAAGNRRQRWQSGQAETSGSWRAGDP